MDNGQALSLQISGPSEWQGTKRASETIIPQYCLNKLIQLLGFIIKSPFQTLSQESIPTNPGEILQKNKIT